MPKWITFTELTGTGKTKRFRIDAITGGELGEVRFFPGWRCYAFYPHPDTLFEHTCLSDIAAFCEQLSDEWRASKRRTSGAPVSRGEG